MAFNWLNLGKKIIEFFVQGIKGMLSSIVNVAKDIIKSITDGGGLKNLPQMAVKWGKDLIDNFVNGIKYGVGKVGDDLRDRGYQVWERLDDPIRHLPQMAVKWGKDLIDNFVNGIKNTIGKVKDAVVNVANTVKDGLPECFAALA